MSYTFLLERGEESSAGCFSGIPASVLSRLSLTAGECSCNGNGTASCPSSPSGTTCEPSTASHGGERLTLCAGDFRAKESALPAVGPGLPTRSQACGASRLESLATYDRDTSSWRTRQCSLFEAGFELLETLPRWGMTAAGELYPLRTPSVFWNSVPGSRTRSNLDHGKDSRRPRPWTRASASLPKRWCSRRPGGRGT